MGAWGTAISSNDTFSDVYSEFFSLYDDGCDVAEISKKLIDDNQETIDDADDCHNFWFALAKAQWECKQLDKDLLDRIVSIVESGADIEAWRQLGAEEKDIRKRKVVLDRFLADLRAERPKARPRKRKTIRQPVFEKGDCLTFKLQNGNYGGAVVLEAINNSEYGYNLIAATRINQPNKPTLSDYINADVLLLNYSSWDNKPAILWYAPIRHKRTAHLIEKVDTIDVQIDYEITNSVFGHVGDFDIWIIQVTDRQFKSEETKPRSTTKQTVKELTKKGRWRLW